jgi:hypothetical protein
MQLDICTQVLTVQQVLALWLLGVLVGGGIPRKTILGMLAAELTLKDVF